MAKAKDSSGQGGGGSSLNGCALVDDLAEACPGDRSLGLLPSYRSTIKLTEAHVDALLKHLGDPANPQRAGVAHALSEAAEYFLPAVMLQSYPTPGASAARLNDIERAAHKLRNLLNLLSSDDSTRLWLRQGATWDDARMAGAVEVVKFIEQAARQAQAVIAERSRPLSKHALRVTVHRLAQCWLYAYGKAPGAGFDSIEGKPAGPFMDFARAFFDALIECTSAEQMNEYPQLGGLLRPSDNTTRAYLKAWKRRQRGKAVHR